MVDRPPSIDRLARSLADHGLPQPIAVEVAREAVAAGDPDSAGERAAHVARSLLHPVINATGVLLHTNLGRAPLAVNHPEAATNLELDLTTGARGSRQDSVGRLAAVACGADGAIVVNNGAGAVLLVLAAIAADTRVIVSRGELVEIGGGFRVPDVMEQSGARLVEVGTTNRTRSIDYRNAVEAAADADEVVGALLKVHRSNYRVVGFTEETTITELTRLGPPVIFDQGSGLLDEACPWLADGPPGWLGTEPGVRQALRAGAAVVTFSGDKLLGGPQAGVIAGRTDLVERCARHPLARALRPGGLVLGALSEVLLAYLRRDGDAIPFWRMATTPVDSLRERAAKVAEIAGPRWSTTDTAAVPGGGSLPGVEIASHGLVATGDHSATLRRCTPAVIARVEADRTIVDLRSVAPSDDADLAAVLAAVNG
ncbi:MAG TPA: L-seryl-tRNA(Sec) selenium transferase [Acidimicrobiales bacterium]